MATRYINKRKGRILNLMSSKLQSHLPRWIAGIVLLAALAGCGRGKVEVYRVAKDTSSTPSQEIAAPNADAPAKPSLDWTLPSGWEEKAPSAMRVASFDVKGSNGQTADVSVIPLPFTGHEMELVNMWRQQMQLPPTADAEVDKETEPVMVGTNEGKLFNVESKELLINNQSRARILVAMVTRGQVSWFFKMTGEDAFVQQQKPAFLNFLKSVVLHGDAEPMLLSGGPHAVSTNVKRVPEDDANKPLWVAPPGWQSAPAEQFLVAKYVVAGTSGGQAEVNISKLAGEGGGELANINRWRGQLGLNPVGEDELNKLIASVEVDGGKALFVDMTGTNARTGQPARMVAAIVPQSGQTWFYKLMGDDAVVAHEKDVFTKFVQTVKYSNVP